MAAVPKSMPTPKALVRRGTIKVSAINGHTSPMSKKSIG